MKIRIGSVLEAVIAGIILALLTHLIGEAKKVQIGLRKNSQNIDL